MTQKSILIAGATGLIGRELVISLLKEGYLVSVITRNIENAQKLFGFKVQVYSWDGKDKNGITIEHADVLINLAGASIGAKPWTKAYKNQLLDSRILSIERLANIVNGLKTAPQLWLQASAIGYYGYNVPMEIDETGEQGYGFLASLVRKWELAFDNVQLPDTRKVKMRLGIVLSESGGLMVEIKKSVKFGMAICPGNGQNYLSYIKIEDLIKFIIATINSNTSGTINMVAESPIKMIELVKIIQEESKVKCLIVVPAFLLTIIMGKEKTRELLLSNQRVISNKLYFKR